MGIITNSETTIARNEAGELTSYPRLAVKWALIYDPTKPKGKRTSKDHLSPADYVPGLPETPKTNAELVAIPDHGKA